VGDATRLGNTATDNNNSTTTTMSFSRSAGRFNLLLLEDGEYYLEDVIVCYCPVPPGKGVKFGPLWARRQKGRLKLCTHSVFFVPNDTALPISKFCFKRVEEIFAAASVFPDPEAASSFVLQATEILQMKADNEVGPYKVVACDDSMQKPKKHLIALQHTDLKTFLAQVKELYGYVTTANETALYRNVISERHVTKFDISNLSDYTERPLLKKVPLVSRVTPMVNCPGCLNLTDSYLYFQPAEINNIQKERITKFALGSIVRIYKRRYMLRQCGLELVMEDNQSVLFVFKQVEERDEVHDVVQEQPRLVMLERQIPLFMNQQLIRWQRGEIDNFEYLMHLNSAADRSFNDLTQYPVMPWVSE
jgi:factor associated with neutral sphingomyelinase activation